MGDLTSEPDVLEPDVVDALREVIDPCCRERGISVVDMGLLHEVAVDDDGHARVRLVLTSGWCPFQTDLLAEVERAVGRVSRVTTVDVGITLDEAWSSARLSDTAAASLRFLPEPSEVGDRRAFAGQSLPVVARPSRPTTQEVNP